MRDLDGDGRIVFMRFRDPNGPWKRHPREPRLLIARGPEDAGGDNWRVVPEGLIAGFDGGSISVLPALEGLDFGVHFPDDRGPGAAGARPAPDSALSPKWLLMSAPSGNGRTSSPISPAIRSAAGF